MLSLELNPSSIPLDLVTPQLTPSRLSYIAAYICRPYHIALISYHVLCARGLHSLLMSVSSVSSSPTLPFYTIDTTMQPAAAWSEHHAPGSARLTKGRD